MMEDTSTCSSPENSEIHTGVTKQPLNTASNGNAPKPVGQIQGQDFCLARQ